MIGLKTHKCVCTALFCVVLSACAQQGSQPQEKTAVIENVTEEAADTILGKLEKHSYGGVFPGAAGEHIRYTLTIQNREYSGDGVFELKISCRDARNKVCKSEEYCGRRYTQRGMPGDSDATVWQLKAKNGRIFNFLYNSTDNTLTLLNDNFEKAGTEPDYTLQPVN